ncbi:MAG: MarR family winged helix-turn-helix transcriptional regulator [Gemmatimonadaceae bacterium]
MTGRAARPTSRRAQLIATLNEAARAHSTASVLFHAAMVEQFGLGPTDAKTLELLERFGPLSAGELVERTRLASPSVTALIDRLEARRFVRRVRDERDRRRVIVELVPEGFKGIADKFGRFTSSVGELWAPYTVEQLQVILDFLQRSTDLVSRRTARNAG